MSFGVYVHVPFCKSKCPYCDFYSVLMRDAEIKEKYTDALVSEIRAFAKYFKPEGNSDHSFIKEAPDSIYFGGGTPSLLEPIRIREIIKDIQDQMGDRELECHTMPVVWGEKWTKVFVTGLIILTLAIIGHLWWHVLPFERGWCSLSTRYIALGIVTPMLGVTGLLWNAKIPSDYKTCQQLVKFTMLLGMLYSICILRGY